MREYAGASAGQTTAVLNTIGGSGFDVAAEKAHPRHESGEDENDRLASVSHVDAQQPTNRRDARHARFRDAFVVQD
jgi:hypothetical protein